MISCLGTWFHVWEHDFMFGNMISCSSMFCHVQDMPHIFCMYRHVQWVQRAQKHAIKLCACMFWSIFHLCSCNVLCNQNIFWTCPKHKQNMVCSWNIILLACFNGQNPVFLHPVWYQQRVYCVPTKCHASGPLVAPLLQGGFWNFHQVYSDKTPFPDRFSQNRLR